MPLSNRRPQRTRREPNKNLDIPDSSPSRPAKRRKKIDDYATHNDTSAATPPLPRDRSGIDLSDDDLISAIVPYLAMPKQFVQASQDHANSLHEKHSKEGVQAYAKLTGKDWTFYVKRLMNNIGRPPECVDNAPLQNISAEVNRDPSHEADDTRVHIDVGPNKAVSRAHANVYYDTDTEKWGIHVTGRNGVRINTTVLVRGDRHELTSGEVVEVGGVEMMFVLPEEDGSLQVHPKYLRRAGLISTENEDPQDEDAAAVLFGTSQQGLPRGQNGLPGPLPIAPAPPDYRRPETPAGTRTKIPYSAGKSSAYINGGTILMNTDNIDLSLDENSHLKPNYSYAQIISQAILTTPDEKLTLNGIYNQIMEKYAYYRHQLGGGWQNSIRHNLSLNKNFTKVPRATNEPGKGMKWCFIPETRDELVRMAYVPGRGGHRGSSQPGSPAAPSRTHDQSSPQKRSPLSGSPPLSSYPSKAPQYTPDPSGHLSRSNQDEFPGDGSPLPRHKRAHNNAFGLSNNVPGSPPALSSSYLQDDINTFITPAPQRVHPRLAPPSTAQRPSQHMTTSSPAPFWRYADAGNTPVKPSPVFDSSPIKLNTIPTAALSSSPAPMRKPSPQRNGPHTKQELSQAEELEDEDEGFDLTKGFQSIGTYHAAPSINGLTVAATVNSRS